MNQPPNSWSPALEQQYRMMAAIRHIVRAAEAIKTAQLEVIAALEETRSDGDMPTDVRERLTKLMRLLYADEVEVVRTGDGGALRCEALVLQLGAFAYHKGSQ